MVMTHMWPFMIQNKKINTRLYKTGSGSLHWSVRQKRKDWQPSGHLFPAIPLHSDSQHGLCDVQPVLPVACLKRTLQRLPKAMLWQNYIRQIIPKTCFRKIYPKHWKIRHFRGRWFFRWTVPQIAGLVTLIQDLRNCSGEEAALWEVGYYSVLGIIADWLCSRDYFFACALFLPDWRISSGHLSGAVSVPYTRMYCPLQTPAVMG